eukprot:g1955.t1 g1955   contig11:420714-421637(+)
MTKSITQAAADAVGTMVTSTENLPSSSDDNESLSDASDVAVTNENDEDDINAAPLHMHALRVPARLRSNIPKVNSDGKLSDAAAAVRSRSRSTSRSRPAHRSSIRSNNSSRSTGSTTMSLPLVIIGENNNNAGNTTAGNTTAGGASSTLGASFVSPHSPHSSIAEQHYFEPDLLLDRLGFIDLDPPLPHEIRCGPLAAPDGKQNNSGGLTPVNERLSEETMDDCHAFQDLVMGYTSTISGGMSTISMPSVAHSSLSNMSIGSASLHSREGSVAGGSLAGEGSLLGLGRLDEEGSDMGSEEGEEEEQS